MCTFWLVEALARAGRLEEARFIFEKMLTYANHLGLYAEETGPCGEALGNFPQAFTHIGLISAAYPPRPRAERTRDLAGHPGADAMTQTTHAYLDRSAADWVAALARPEPAGPPAGRLRPGRERPGATRKRRPPCRPPCRTRPASCGPGPPPRWRGSIRPTRRRWPPWRPRPTDERSFVRSLAVWHLGRLGPDAPRLRDALPAMHRLLATPTPASASRPPWR